MIIRKHAIPLLMALVAASSPQVATARSAAEVHAALERAKAHTIQFRLPGEDDPTLVPRKKEVFVVPPEPDKPAASSEWTELAKMLIWMVAICAGALLMVRFDDFMTWPWAKPRGRMPGVGEEYVAPSESSSVLAVSDELARNGLHAEAMHELLVGSIQILRRRLDETISASLTSREIARSLALPTGERDAITQFVGLVERTWFGTTPADPDTYDVCKEYFLKLAPARGF